ncbi:MAG: hypothetical protein EPN55_02540 [Gammaproteobacteria bacterium]|nr:MAG: hypothetical protein EPN55_02540 [Gammaproteobacteria bacterium]
MSVAWNKGYDPDALAKHIESQIVSRSGGELKFRGFGFHDDISVLQSCLVFSETLPEVAKREVITAALFAAAKRSALTARSILAEVSRQEREYFKKSKQKFILITSISDIPNGSFLRRRVGDAIVTFQKLTRLQLSQHEQIRKDSRSLFDSELPRHYLPIRAEVSVRSKHEAWYAGLDAIDLLRGIWNLHLNMRTYTRWSSGKRKPINEIQLGPVHSLHIYSGRLATQGFWYEPNYRGPANTLSQNRQDGKVAKFERQALNRLRSISYHQLLKDAIRRYVRALDQHDYNATIIQLWSVLESLTVTVTDSYKVTIRRAAMIHDDSNFHRQVLTHLKDYRNNTIHAGAATEENEVLVFQSKRYVESMILFHLNLGPSFESLDECAEFLDLPADIAKLRRRQGLLNRAIKFRS